MVTLALPFLLVLVGRWALSTLIPRIAVMILLLEMNEDGSSIDRNIWHFCLTWATFSGLNVNFLVLTAEDMVPLLQPIDWIWC